MDNVATEFRDYGSAPFKTGDIDLDALKKTLRNKRKIDLFLLNFIPLSDAGVTNINEEEAIRAFNKLIDSDFYAHVDGDLLRLRPEIRRMLPLAIEAHKKGHEIESEIIRVLNRALIHAVYPEETVKTRSYERFSVPELMRLEIHVFPLSSEKGEAVEGKLLNISLGGMALLLPKKLPDLTYWSIQIALGDHAEIETLVQIRHSVPQQNQFVHGFQFVSIASYLNELRNGRNPPAVYDTPMNLDYK